MSLRAIALESFSPGGGTWRGEVSVVRAELRSPPGLKLSRALARDRLALIVDSCNGDPEVSLLRETDVDVQVKVVASSTPLRGGKDCRDVVEVQLQEPLGGRVVVDKHTGQSVTVITDCPVCLPETGSHSLSTPATGTQKCRCCGRRTSTCRLRWLPPPLPYEAARTAEMSLRSNFKSH